MIWYEAKWSQCKVLWSVLINYLLTNWQLVYCCGWLCHIELTLSIYDSFTLKTFKNHLLLWWRLLQLWIVSYMYRDWHFECECWWLSYRWLVIRICHLVEITLIVLVVLVLVNLTWTRGCVMGAWWSLNHHWKRWWFFINYLVIYFR